MPSAVHVTTTHDRPLNRPPSRHGVAHLEVPLRLRAIANSKQTSLMPNLDPAAVCEYDCCWWLVCSPIRPSRCPWPLCITPPPHRAILDGLAFSRQNSVESAHVSTSPVTLQQSALDLSRRSGLDNLPCQVGSGCLTGPGWPHRRWTFSKGIVRSTRSWPSIDASRDPERVCLSGPIASPYYEWEANLNVRNGDTHAYEFMIALRLATAPRTSRGLRSPLFPIRPALLHNQRAIQAGHSFVYLLKQPREPPAAPSTNRSANTSPTAIEAIWRRGGG